MKTFAIQNIGGEELARVEAESRTDKAVRDLANECCENIRQVAIERDGVDPGFFADDVVIVEMED